MTPAEKLQAQRRMLNALIGDLSSPQGVPLTGYLPGVQGVPTTLAPSLTDTSPQPAPAFPRQPGIQFEQLPPMAPLTDRVGMPIPGTGDVAPEPQTAMGYEPPIPVATAPLPPIQFGEGGPVPAPGAPAAAAPVVAGGPLPATSSPSAGATDPFARIKPPGMAMAYAGPAQAPQMQPGAAQPIPPQGGASEGNMNIQQALWDAQQGGPTNSSILSALQGQAPPDGVLMKLLTGQWG